MKKSELAHKMLSEMLGEGRMLPQSRLPPERDLARQFAVSRTALRAGLDRLESEGRIWRHVGQGTFVGSRPEKPPKQFSFITANTSPADALEARLAIEPQIARMAALRASQTQISEIAALVQKGKFATDATTWESWDGQFHRALCLVTGNRLLLSIFDSFNAIRKQKTWNQLRRNVLTAERRKLYAEHHQAILDAISERDAAQAERAMRLHIEEVARGLINFGS
ncbi:FadR/GntR family transcriptional regulator [Aestuariivirga sp.]|uniref:FadR/GntR family transcriptional regulator n=1 Tax=Aestuariivirga sp. TaxID=2650926 RepID=UPI0039E3E491